MTFHSFLSGYNIYDRIDQISDLSSSILYRHIYRPSIMITHVHNNATYIISTHPHRSHSVVASCWPHCHKYKMNSEEQNEIQNWLHSWHKKKNIKCPSCKSPLFHFDGRPYFSSAHIVNESVVLHHSPCTSSIGNCGKVLFFCLSCGSQSSHTSGRLQDKGCKCV